MFDYDYTLKTAGLVDSCSGTIVAGATIVTIGDGLLEANCVIDVTAIEIASNDELYTICVQGSSESDFASTVENLAILELGALEVLNYSDVDSTTGRYILPVRNEVNGTKYPYLRLICDVAGDVATGINFTARLEKG